MEFYLHSLLTPTSHRRCFLPSRTRKFNRCEGATVTR